MPFEPEDQGMLEEPINEDIEQEHIEKPVSEDTEQDQDKIEEPVNEDLEQDENKGRRTAFIVIAVIVALILLIFGVLIGSGYFRQPEPTSQPPQAAVFISITEPVQNARVDISTPVTVTGMGGGLFEGNVVVQALDAAGNLLAQQPTTISAPDAGLGGAGPWSVQLNIIVAPGTAGLIYAFSTSPESGETVAEAWVDVVFGQAEFIQPYLTLTDPQNGATLPLDTPFGVSGMGAGLPEGNVVVQALDQSGNVIAEQPTIIKAPDAGIGGEGPWSVTLTIPSAQVAGGTLGQVVAFSNSPADGSTLASTSVNVTYGEIPPPEEEAVKLEDHLWMLALLNNQAVVENTRITLELQDGQASGSAGCNRYNAGYVRSQIDLTFSGASSTEMFCELPEGLMDQESAYLSTLEGALTFNLTNQQLQVFNSAGDPILDYMAAVVGNVVADPGAQLPEGAIVRVQVSDVSLADAPAAIIGEQIIQGATQFPIPFAVTYDPEIIVENHTYGVSVRVEDSAGNLIFSSTTAYNVITSGNPSELDVAVAATQ